MSNYRFDVRSKENFILDIKRDSAKEAEIAVRLCIKVHAKTGKWPELIANGTDFTGKFVEDKCVSSLPDFIIGNRSVEITRSDSVCYKHFHQKQAKVNRAIKDKTDIVFVNGFAAQKQPNLVWMMPCTIEEFTNKSISKYGNIKHPGKGRTGQINKAAFRYDIYWFKDLWTPLPVLIKNIPEEYKKILSFAKRE